MKGKYAKITISIIVVVLILAFVIGYCIELNKQKDSKSKIITESTDLKVEYNESELTGDLGEYVAKITLSDSKITIDGSGVITSENTIKITKAGTYYITGSLSDGNIVIEADKSDDVQIVLDNCSITSKTTAPINCVKAGKLTITLADNSENTITDNSSYTVFTDTEKEEPNSAIFSKSDLVINGNGKLIINANYEDGIASKDGLKIINVTIEINSEDDGIRGKDYVAINNANITINSKGDSIKSTNSDDEGLGYILIDGGTYELSSGDDGIHAETSIVINNGNINITKSYEGIESGYIEINGGIISVTASDDGINISGGNDSSSMIGRQGQNSFTSIDSSNRKLVINGGDITVNANGDGLDSNGSIYMNGGKVLVIGTTSNGNGALDFDGEMVVTGGELIAYGSTGMWQSPSSASTQYSLTFSVSSGKSGDVIVLKDSSGNEIATTTTQNSYQGIIISNSSIKNGETYTLYVNGINVGSLTASSTVTSNITSSGPMGGGGMMQQDRNGSSGNMKQNDGMQQSGGKPGRGNF